MYIRRRDIISPPKRIMDVIHYHDFDSLNTHFKFTLCVYVQSRKYRNILRSDDRQFGAIANRCILGFHIIPLNCSVR